MSKGYVYVPYAPYATYAPYAPYATYVPYAAHNEGGAYLRVCRYI